MEIIFYIFILILGVIVGSFLNVVILRYNTGLSIAKGRSRCFSCGKDLSWSELVPILSFVFLRGRCKKCKSKISWQYPIVELLSGLLFVATFWRLGGLEGLAQNTFHPLFYLIIVSVLLVLTVYDIKHKIISDGLLIILGAVALSRIFLVFYPNWLAILNFILGAVVLALPLFLISYLSRGKLMGLGDPKLVLCLSLILGPSAGLHALVLAFWIGALYGLLLMALSRLHLLRENINRKSELPFAPFLVLGFLLVFLFQVDVLKIMSLVL